MGTRLTRVAEGQLERYGRLEESINKLSQRLEPFLQASDVMVDQKRLESLEEKIMGLTSMLAVLDVDGEWLPQPKRRRPPSPPRALLAPAPPRLDRARSQGGGDGGISGER